MLIDGFVEVQTRILERSAESVRLSHGRRSAWVPRAEIHGYDDCEIDGAEIGETLPVRVTPEALRAAGFGRR